MKFPKILFFALMSPLLASASDPLDGFPTACVEAVRKIAPQHPSDAVLWICGASANTLVPGAGQDPAYVSCVADALRTSTLIPGDDLTLLCHGYAQRGRRKYTTPTAVYCEGTLLRMNPKFTQADVKWLCGTSGNSPAVTYSQNECYADCIIKMHEFDMSVDGVTKVRGCTLNIPSSADGESDACARPKKDQSVTQPIQE